MAQGLVLQATTHPAVRGYTAQGPRRASRSYLAPTRVPVQRQVRTWSVASDDVELEEDLMEPVFEDADGPSSGLTTQQVSSVLTMLCEETDIMQIELKMGDFELYAQRSIKGVSGGSTASTSGGGMAETPFSPPVAGLSPQQNMGQSQAPPPNPTQSVMTVDEEVDESMIFIESPKVGVFRRGRYAKGKRIGKGNVCEPGDEVKKGQTLAYVEQLGTFVPVESPQAGQIATFSCDEGESVEYKQHVIELAPFFGGHIIGESKWN